MSFVQQPLHSKNYNPLDPERSGIRNELKLRAIHDATKATDAIRANLRRDLKAARMARDEGGSTRVRQLIDST